MIQRIKQVLLTQYIGAIVIGFLAVQGIAVLISIPVSFLAVFFRNRTRPHSVFDTGFAYDWATVVPSVLSAALHFLIAYLLLRWLFLNEPNSVNENGAAHDQPTEESGAA